MRPFAVILAVATAATVVSPLGAQNTTAVRTTDFGISVGAAIPVGDRLRQPQQFTLEPPELDVADGARTGLAITASVGIRPVNSLLNYRIELQYSRFGLEPSARYGPGNAPETATGHVSSLGASGNVALMLPVPGILRPYVIGGAGIYRLTSDITQEPNSTFGPQGHTRFGLNGGVGTELSIGRLRTYAEARYHGVFINGSDVGYIPITIGMRF